MNIAVITVGMPGSGKTTFARHFLDINPKAVIVSKDEIRKALYGSKKGFWNSPHRNDGMIRQLAYATAERVAIDHDLCICNTNYDWNAVQPYITNIQHNCRVFVKHFDVDWEELVRRNRHRPNDDRIDMQYLKQTWDQYQAATPWWRAWPQWEGSDAPIAYNYGRPPSTGTQRVLCDGSGKAILDR